MKVLNIFRSRPEEKFKSLADSITYGGEVEEIHLYDMEEVDYDVLLELIFANDRVYSWW